MKKAIILLATIVAYSQTNPQFTTPAPAGVTSVGASVVGNSGIATYCYWVIANYPAGSITPRQPVCVTDGPSTTTSSNYVKISWNNVTNVSNYTVVRTLDRNFPPTGLCTSCVVVAGTTNLTVNNDNTSLTNLTSPVVAIQPVNANWNVDNVNYSSPRSFITPGIDPSSIIGGGAQNGWIDNGTTVSTTRNASITGTLFVGPTVVDPVKGITSPSLETDIRTCGAKGDNSTDDTSAINTCVAAMPFKSTLTVSPGRYVLKGSSTQLLLFTKAISIRGQGPDSIFIVDSSVPNTTDVIRYQSQTGVDMRDVQISGITISPNSGAPGKCGIQLDSTLAPIAKLHIHHVNIAQLGGNKAICNTDIGNGYLFTSKFSDNFLQGGLTLLNVGDSIWITNNVISGTGIGVDIGQVSGAGSLDISENNITTNSGAIKLRTAQRPVIRHNNIEPTTGGTYPTPPMLDIQGTVSFPIERPIIADNFIGGSVGAITGVVPLRLDYTIGAVVRDDSIYHDALGSYGVEITANATGPKFGEGNIFNPSDHQIHNLGSNTTIVRYATLGAADGLANVINGAGTAAINYGASITAASTITPTAELMRVTGSTAIQTITVPAGMSAGGCLTFIPFPSAAWSLGTSGNIGLSAKPIVGQLMRVCYDGSFWWPSYPTTTGTVNAVYSTSPTLITPILGVAAATSINGTSIPTSVTLASVLTGTSASIGGGLLTAGTCATGTATVTGATTSMTATLPQPTTYPGDGFEIYAYISAADTVTIKVCALVALTPTASTYLVKVIN